MTSHLIITILSEITTANWFQLARINVLPFIYISTELSGGLFAQTLLCKCIGGGKDLRSLGDSSTVLLQRRGTLPRDTSRTERFFFFFPAPCYCSTWPRVSGSLRAKKLPAASAPEAKRIGTALVMPTNDVKMLMPSTAASLQRALRKPNAVVLEGKG